MDDLSCTICHENYRNTDEIHSTSCGHIYHAHCIQQWKSRSSYCPQCRFSNPTSHRIFLTLNSSQSAERDRKLQETNLKLEQSLLKVSELEHQLQESEINFLDLQGQYNQHENKLKELKVKIEYLTLQNESREKELTLKAVEIHKLQEALKDAQKSGGEIVMCEKIKVLEEKLREVSVELAKETRNSTELAVDKMKLQSILDQSNSPQLPNPSRSYTDARSCVVKGLAYAGSDMNFVTVVLKLAHQMGLQYTEQDIESASRLNCNHYVRNNISPERVSVVVIFKSAQLMLLFLENRNRLKLSRETDRIVVCEYISYKPNPSAVHARQYVLPPHSRGFNRYT